MVFDSSQKLLEEARPYSANQCCLNFNESNSLNEYPQDLLRSIH